MQLVKHYLRVQSNFHSIQALLNMIKQNLSKMRRDLNLSIFYLMFENLWVEEQSLNNAFHIINAQ